MNNQFYDNLKQYLETLTLPAGLDEMEKKKIKKLSVNYVVKNDLLFKDTKEGLRRVITKDQVEAILYNLHQDLNAAHLGIDAVFEKVKTRYFWPQMFEDVRTYVKTCDTCQRRGSQTRREPLTPLKIEGPFCRVGIDIKGPLPRTEKGNRYIIVAMDYFTKWPEARAVDNIRAETVAKFIYEDIICRHGVPKEILSDRGTSFVNQVIIDALCENYQTKH